MGRTQKSLLMALILASGNFIAVPAQEQGDDDLRRGVARISVIDGDVSVRRGDSGEWVAAAPNAPVMTGDGISTGTNSRTELQFDASNTLRLGGNAELRLTQLEYSRYQMEVAHGTVTFTVLKSSGIDIEVDTPSASVRPTKQGVYRISVNDNGETQVIARSGEVEVFTPRGSQWISTGQMLTARGTGDAEYQIANAPPLDDWDRWNQSRDRVITESTSYKYVPPGVYGVEELDQYGDWVNVDSYGWSWRPRGVYSDWSPYSVGRWAWEDWYGWTWISADPWGWAPYHYGRWYYAPRYGWCWYPGAFGARHYWSPAQVAFFGFGSGGGFGFGFGNVGWVPLAPFEPYHRWWGRGYYGARFNNNINITNINIYNSYRNARVRNGIIGVGVADFRDGRFSRVSRYSGDQVREAGLVRGRMPFTPSNTHLRFSDREGRNFSNRNWSDRRMFTHERPNPVDRHSFAQQQRGMENGFRGDRGFGGNDRFGGRDNRDGDRGGDRRDRFNQPSRGGDGGSFAVRPEQNGWRRFGDPTDSGAGRGSTFNRGPDGRRDNGRPEGVERRPATPDRGGWQRFGNPGGSQRNQRNFQDNSEGRRGDGQFSPGWRNEQPSIRTGPPVRERPQRSFDRPSFGQPRQDAPRQEQRQFGGGGLPRGFGGGGSGGGANRQMAPPRNFGGGGNGRQMGSPRGGGGGGGGGPRQFGGGGSQNRSGGGGSRHR